MESVRSSTVNVRDVFILGLALVFLFAVQPSLVRARDCTETGCAGSATCLDDCTLQEAPTCVVDEFGVGFCESDTITCTNGRCSGGECVSATEYCDGVDNDCDGDVDVDDSDVECCDDSDCASDEYCYSRTCRACDADGDGHDRSFCGGDDCNDRDDEMYPGNTEVCDSKDNDCDGTVDEGVATCFAAQKQTMTCEGAVDCSSYTASNCPTAEGCYLDYGDCMFLGPNDYSDCPGCSGDSLLECSEGSTSVCKCAFYEFTDGPVCAGGPPCESGDCGSDGLAGCEYDYSSTDCGDFSYSDCSGEGCSWECCDYVDCYYDNDGDGEGGSFHEQSTCFGTCVGSDVKNDYDCDDSDEFLNSETTWYLDADGDRYYAGQDYDDAVVPNTCARPSSDHFLRESEAPGHSLARSFEGGGDCRDDLAAVNPGASSDPCDDVNNDCDEEINEDAACGSTFCSAPHTVGSCSDSCSGGSCTSCTPSCSCEDGWYDANGDMSDGCEASCDADGDGFDAAACGGSDCDDASDCLAPGRVWYRDADGDGYVNQSDTVTQCSWPGSGWYARDVVCS